MRRRQMFEPMSPVPPVTRYFAITRSPPPESQTRYGPECGVTTGGPAERGQRGGPGLGLPRFGPVDHLGAVPDELRIAVAVDDAAVDDDLGPCHKRCRDAGEIQHVRHDL